jgi:uncharacterized membrane protein YphA (DoxX/SURF4 family)
MIVGLVFLSEGLQKFILHDTAVERFAKIGFENPDFTTYFVASFEVACSLLILAGFLTRVAAIPLLIVMATAITTTKIPILINSGFWSMAHEARTDFSMTLLLVFLLVYGAGRLSIDMRYRNDKR